MSFQDLGWQVDGITLQSGCSFEKRGSKERRVFKVNLAHPPGQRSTVVGFLCRGLEQQPPFQHYFPSLHTRTNRRKKKERIGKYMLRKSPSNATCTTKKELMPQCWLWGKVCCPTRDLLPFEGLVMHARAEGGKGGGNETWLGHLWGSDSSSLRRVVSDAYESNRLALIISLA